jgi:hypothetical protein
VAHLQAALEETHRRRTGRVSVRREQPSLAVAEMTIERFRRLDYLLLIASGFSVALGFFALLWIEHTQRDIASAMLVKAGFLIVIGGLPWIAISLRGIVTNRPYLIISKDCLIIHTAFAWGARIRWSEIDHVSFSRQLTIEYRISDTTTACMTAVEAWLMRRGLFRGLVGFPRNQNTFEAAVPRFGRRNREMPRELRRLVKEIKRRVHMDKFGSVDHRP